MIADLLKVMAAGGIASTFVCAYLQHLGVPGIVLTVIAGAVGAVMAWLMTYRSDQAGDDGRGYLRRRG